MQLQGIMKIFHLLNLRVHVRMSKRTIGNRNKGKVIEESSQIVNNLMKYYCFLSSRQKSTLYIY